MRRIPASPHSAWALAALACLMISQAAFAKEVHIRWKPMKKAAKYELHVLDDTGKEVLTEKDLKESGWKGDLAPGHYTYLIRAIDKFERLGRATYPLPLVVMPPPPKPEAPGEGGTVKLFDPAAPTTLHWATAPGASKYSVEVYKDGKSVAKLSAATPHVDFKGMAPGKYSYVVKPVVVSQARTPASAPKGTPPPAAQQWEGKADKPVEFVVQYSRLSRPEPLYPLQKIPPTDDRKIRFGWKAVPGAEAYEVRLVRSESEGRRLASELLTTRSVITKETEVVLTAKTDGKYAWQVRALANIDSKNVAGASGPESTSAFQLSKSAIYSEGSGYVAFSLMAAPYQYISDAGGNQEFGASVGFTGRLSAEYWFGGSWGIAAAAELNWSVISGANYFRKQFELQAKYRAPLGSLKNGWFISPKLGIEARDYILINSIIASGGGINNVGAMAIGPSIGLDIRKQFTEKFSVGFKCGYFVPVVVAPEWGNFGGSSISYDGETGIQPDPTVNFNGIPITNLLSLRNVSAGLQAVYWLKRNFGLAGGAYGELRSIGFSTNPATSNGASQAGIVQDGIYVYGSVLYTFGY